MISGRILVLGVSMLGAACATSPEPEAPHGSDEQAVDAPQAGAEQGRQLGQARRGEGLRLEALREASRVKSRPPI